MTIVKHGKHLVSRRAVEVAKCIHLSILRPLWEGREKVSRQILDPIRMVAPRRRVPGLEETMEEETRPGVTEQSLSVLHDLSRLTCYILFGAPSAPRRAGARLSGRESTGGDFRGIFHLSPTFWFLPMMGMCHGLGHHGRLPGVTCSRVLLPQSRTETVLFFLTTTTTPPASLQWDCCTGW